MVVIAVSPGTIATAGPDATSESNLPVDPSEPINTSGVPVSFQVATPTPSAEPDAARAIVYDEDGVFVRHVTNPTGLSWLDEFNSAGSGEINLLRYERDESTTSLGSNLATNPNGDDGDTDYSPPITLTEDNSPPAGGPSATALHAQVNVGFARTFNHDPINVGAAPQTVRCTWYGYVTGAGNELHIDFAISNSDFTDVEGVMTPVVIVPADGWVAVTADIQTTTDHPYVAPKASLQALGSNADSWVTALSVQVLTTSVDTEHFGQLNSGDQIKIAVGDLDVFRLILDSDPGYRIDADTGDRTDYWAGLGALGVINSGMVEPEYGFRPEATDERSFDYGSNPNIGGWYVPAEWKTPVGKLVRQSWRWIYRKRHLPKGWPDRKAQWLWWKSPDSASVPDEFCYFISSFTASTAGRYKFWACGDDTLELQIDGEIRLTAGPGAWKKASTVVLQLSAGVHTVAAKVQNSPATDGNSNRSGFLCTIARVQSDGDIITYARRTTPATWKVRRQLSGPPGWFPAQAAMRLVEEQKSRGCASHAAITYGFTTSVDSSKAAWTARHDFSLTVGTLGLDWMQRLVEMGVDVAMSPNLKLDMWKRRGSDRSKYIRIDQFDSYPVDEGASTPPGKRNVAYARAKTGWAGASDSAGVTADGRRETMISLGSSRSRTQTNAVLARMLPDLSDPPQTVEIRLTAATRYQPYRDFNVGDWISYKAAGMTSWGRFRVMSIAGEINEAGFPDWALQLYEA